MREIHGFRGAFLALSSALVLVACSVEQPDVPPIAGAPPEEAPAILPALARNPQLTPHDYIPTLYAVEAK